MASLSVAAKLELLPVFVQAVDTTIGAMGFEANNSALEMALMTRKSKGSRGKAWRQCIADAWRGSVVSVPIGARIGVPIGQPTTWWLRTGESLQALSWI